MATRPWLPGRTWSRAGRSLGVLLWHVPAGQARAGRRNDEITIALASQAGLPANQGLAIAGATAGLSTGAGWLVRRVVR
jgi:hypothetical protein